MRTKLNPANPEEGLSLLETIVGILMATTFTLVMLQTIVMAALLKSKALKESEAVKLIEEDLEIVRNESTNYKRNSLASNANSGDNTITINSSSSYFASNDEVRIGSAGTYTVNSVDMSSTPPTLTLDSNLSQSVAAEKTVAAIAYCNAPDRDSGYADQFRDFLHTRTRYGSGSAQSGDSTLTYEQTGVKSGYNYTIQIRLSPKNQEPYDVLTVEYAVYDLSQNEFSSASTTAKEDALLTENYAEIIPYASFDC